MKSGIPANSVAGADYAASTAARRSIHIMQLGDHAVHHGKGDIADGEIAL